MFQGRTGRAAFGSWETHMSVQRFDVGGDVARPRPTGTTLTGGGLQTLREYLGLTTGTLAALLGVEDVAVRRWEAGLDAIPERVGAEVASILATTAAAVDELHRALDGSPGAGVVVYRTDQELHAARGDLGPLTARWWRHVVARAAVERSRTQIGTRAELQSLQGLRGPGAVRPGPTRSPS